MQVEMKYNVSLSETARGITRVCVIVVVGLLGLLLVLGLALDAGRAYFVEEGIVSLLVLMALFGCYWLSPKAIVTDAGRLTLKRHIGEKTIPFADIMRIERYGDMNSDLRICGVGGVFGFTGWFSGASGKYFAYVGDSRDAILITTRRRKYVMSCDRPDELVAEVRQRLGQTDTQGKDAPGRAREE